MKVYRTCFKRNFKILLNLLSFCSVVVGVLNSFNQKLLIFFYILSTGCLITIWQNATSLREQLVEGQRLVFMNLNAISPK